MSLRAFAVSPALVIGGGGFIGSALRKRLSAAEIPVTVLSRSASDYTPLFNETWITGSLGDETLLERILTSGQNVYHLASSSIPACGNWDVEDDIYKSVLPTLALLKLAVQKKVRRIIFVSSGGTVYGPGAPVPTPEDALTAPITSYGASKLSIETYLRIFQHHHGLEYRIARVANPFGPGQMPQRQQGVIANLMYQALQGHPFQIWGDGSVARDFIHVDDVATALLALEGHTGENRVFNVGSGQARTIKSITQDIATAIGNPDHPVVYNPSRSFDVPVSYLDSSRLSTETGWAPQRDWAEGLRETRDWIQSRKF